MGRLPLSGNKVRKIKIGTTVQETTAAILEEIRRNNPESIRSTGEVIDYLCNLLAELTPRTAKVVDEACVGEVQLITNEMRALPLDGSEQMSFSQKELEREQLQRLHKHFSQYREKEDKPQGMKRVDLLGGDYAVFPSSWVLLEPDSCGASCNQVGIIEVRGGSKYNAPHFVFFHNGDYSQKDKLQHAVKLWPRMTDVIRDEVKLITDDEGHYLNMDEHLAAPIICYFNLLDASYYQSMELEPPYGAMIYRNDVD